MAAALVAVEHFAKYPIFNVIRRGERLARPMTIGRFTSVRFILGVRESGPHIKRMNIRRHWLALGRIPAVRTGLFVTGIVLITVSPLVGIVPGPGGVVVFAAGLALVLKYSEWAKRRYVRFKRRHPNKGRWADWGMRRASARRREKRLREYKPLRPLLDD